jgi:hypothetical protein
LKSQTHKTNTGTKKGPGALCLCGFQPIETKAKKSFSLGVKNELKQTQSAGRPLLMRDSADLKPAHFFSEMSKCQYLSGFRLDNVGISLPSQSL